MTATISPCGRYRYTLTREWARALYSRVDGNALFIMLNPSTADADVDDPTIRKCIGFAKRLGQGSIEVVNLFAFRATYPCDLDTHTGDRIGPDNDQHIKDAIERAGLIVFAWGGTFERAAWRIERETNVMAMVYGRRQPFCLGKTAYGSPRHPLMLPYTTGLSEYVIGGAR